MKYFFCALGLLLVATSTRAALLQKPLSFMGNDLAPGLSPIHTMDSWKWENCGSPTDLVELESLSIKPDPPQKGQNLTITATGTVKQVIEEGAVADVSVKLGLIKLISKSFDICEEAKNANLDVQCPVQEGTYTLVRTVELPKEIPPAKFGINVNAYSVQDEDILCLKLTVDFLKFLQ